MPSSFDLQGHSVRFRTAEFDGEHDLVIDPIRSWATYFGASKDDKGRRVRADSAGNLFVSGYTNSLDFPLVNLPGAYNQTDKASIFLSKFSPEGELLWSTYYATSGSYAADICIDNQDNLYMVGQTVSSNFPTQELPGAYFQPALSGLYDSFILKFNTAGERLWSTFYGGSEMENSASVCTDADGNLYVYGITWSEDFPVQNLPGAFNQPQKKIYYDLFILKFNAAGERRWATYYGGARSDWAGFMCIDSTGQLYVAGHTASVNFPLQELPGTYYQPLKKSEYDLFLVKFDSNQAREWATFYGGSDDDFLSEICTDASDNFYVSGRTHSQDFPVKSLPGAYNQLTNAGYDDLFLLKFNAQGERLWATYYGGTHYERLFAICTDHLDNLYVTGYTPGDAFPLQELPGAYNQPDAGSYDAYLLKFNNRCVRQYATIYGGSNEDYGYGLCTDKTGNLYLTGYTKSTDFPLKQKPGAYHQATKDGPTEAFILRFDVPFTADSDTLSVSAGGTINLFLDAGEANAGRLYLILGSQSGWDPGLALPGGAMTLPVNWDKFTNFVINNLNITALQYFFAHLDAEGKATAQVIGRAGLDPGKIGTTMVFAYCLEPSPFWDFASNPVLIDFVP